MNAIRQLYIQCLLLSIVAVLVLNHQTIAQDIGVVNGSGLEVIEDPELELTDPYKLSITTKPLALLLLPVTGGSMINGNFKIDYALNRRTTVALAFNYFRQRPFWLMQTDWEAISVKLDYQYHFLNEDNPKMYAEGLHVGPYGKLRYEELLDPNGAIQGIGGYAEGITVNGGGIVGYKLVSNWLVLDFEGGIGLGYMQYSYGSGLNVDFRAGMYFGFVAK